MYLLDTNVLSEIRKIRPGNAHPAVAAWAERVDFDRCYLSVITLLEIEQGILRVRHRGDEAQFARLENKRAAQPQHSSSPNASHWKPNACWRTANKACIKSPSPSALTNPPTSSNFSKNTPH